MCHICVVLTKKEKLMELKPILLLEGKAQELKPPIFNAARQSTTTSAQPECHQPKAVNCTIAPCHPGKFGKEELNSNVLLVKQGNVLNASLFYKDCVHH